MWSSSCVTSYRLRVAGVTNRHHPKGTTSGVCRLRHPSVSPTATVWCFNYIEDTSGNLCEAPYTDCDRNAEPWTDLVYRDTGTVRLQNAGGSALQLSLSIAESNLFVLPNGETTLSLPPGDSYDLTVQFAPEGFDDKAVYSGALSIQAGAKSASFRLAGIFMPKPEGGREVYLEGVVNQAFGYQTDLGANSQGGLTSAAPDSPLAGDEVRSAYWRAANAGQPVVATQIAAFHGCCRLGDRFELWAAKCRRTVRQYAVTKVSTASRSIHLCRENPVPQNFQPLSTDPLRFALPVTVPTLTRAMVTATWACASGPCKTLRASLLKTPTSSPKTTLRTAAVRLM